jgi:phosphoribosylformylglycinamidine synthase
MVGHLPMTPPSTSSLGEDRSETPSGAHGALPAAWRIELFRRADDPAGEAVLRAARELHVKGISAVRAGRGFLLPPSLSRDEVSAIAADLLADPVLDEPRLTAPGEAPEARGAHRVLAAPLPGVMDPLARTLEELLRRSGRLPGGASVGTFRVWELDGGASPADLLELGRRSLANEVVEELHVDDEALAYGAPTGEATGGEEAVPLAGASDEELLEISRLGHLSLNLVEMHAVRDHYAALDRHPTICELETLAQTWSEHCKHKTLTGVVEMDGERIDNVLKSTIFAATRDLDLPWCISVFSDNAGIVEFEDGWDVCFKVETHNHPSAIDPYGGAGTGIGGVIRDILGAGLGARPIANTDAFFVGPLDLAPEDLPKGCMHPRRILRGVVDGVRDYGNRMGIPTVSGGVWHHAGYIGNPLVYAGTVGLLRREHAFKQVLPGDLIVTAGGRTGRDGIHGATFSSIELSDESEMVSAGAVQIGDPITEKTVLDCQLAARDRGLYRAVTDCGAGGFSSAVGEMGEETGAEVELADVPLKYPGLAPHEVWISEAQERMVFAVPPEKADELLALFASENVEATVIGRFTGDGRLVVKHSGRVVCDVDMGFLHDGCPRPVRPASWTAPTVLDPGCPAPADAGLAWDRAVLDLVGHPDSRSKEWIIRQYDHTVQGRSVLEPLVGVRADAPGNSAVLRPLPDSRRGLAIACGANPHQGALDPRSMALASIDEAIRNVVAVGADPSRVALLDNFSWGNCDRPEQLGALVLAAKACQDAAMAYRAPFISGKDSLNNEYRTGDEVASIPHTLLISAIAPVPDVTRSVTMDLKEAGNAVWLAGATRAELGGSTWLQRAGSAGGTVPCPDLVRAPRLLAALHGAIAAGHVRACHDLSEGGLAVAGAEAAFAGERGLELDLAAVPVETLDGAACDTDAARMFSESCTRFLVEVAPEHEAELAAALDGLPAARIGSVTDDGLLRVKGTAGDELLALDLEQVRAAHTGGFSG